MNSVLLLELARLFKYEAMHENSCGRSDGMRLFCISLGLEERAREKRFAEREAEYMGELA